MTEFFDPNTLIGALSLGVLFGAVATLLAALVRRLTQRLAPHLTDVTGLAFASALGQVMVYLGLFVLYAHLVPDLRALGTALLTGVSIVSVVIGLAAQNTLGNVVAGVSLVLYRPVRVGDWVRLSAPTGVTTAQVELLSLGYTTLRDPQGSHILVPNSVMVSSVVIRLSKPPELSSADD